MAVTARTLISDALSKLAVLGSRQPAKAEDLALGLRTLNRWVTDLETAKATMVAQRRRTLSLVANTASYTIGPGGVWNIPRPVDIAHFGIILDDTASLPVEIPILNANPDQWRAVTAKTLTATHPRLAYYDRRNAAGLGTVYVHPIPTTNTVDLVGYIDEALTEFADLSTEYILAAGLERMVVYNLAIELAPDFDREPSGAVIEVARRSMETFKRGNQRERLLGVDPRLRGMTGAYNIWTDD